MDAMAVLRMAAVLLLLAGIVAAAQEPITCDGLDKEIIEVPVSGNHGNAFEYKDTGMTYRGSVGEVYVGRSAAHGNIMAALRFDGVHVPKDSRIVEARVRLADAHAGDVCCEGTNLTVLLAMERTVDSTPLPLHHTPGWLLTRLQRTESLTWKPPATVTYAVTETPNLRAMVQSLVTMEGWAPGSAITVLMDGNGTVEDVDERVYFGSGLSHEHKAKLRITYCEPQLPLPPTVLPKCPKCIRNATLPDGVVLMESGREFAMASLPSSAITAGAVCGVVGALLAIVAAVRASSHGRSNEDTASCRVVSCSQLLQDEAQSFMGTDETDGAMCTVSSGLPEGDLRAEGS